MLNQIINIINEKLKTTSLERFDSTLFGITETTPIEDNESVVFRPTIIDNDGECILMSLDNLLDVQIYHRLNTKLTSVNTQQYGSNNGVITDTYNVSLFVSSNRRKTKIQSHELSELISNYFPDVIKENGKQIAIINLGLCDYNSAIITNSEFNGYSGMPDIYMFRQDYQIKHQYKKRCIETCEIECKNYSSN